MKRIVVGTDGSDDALAAVRQAVELARLSSAELELVSAWQPYYGTVELPVAVDNLEARALEALRTTRAAVDTSGLEVSEVLVQGDPARALLEQAEGADLLVVGSRGHGGFAGLLLGSVSQKCVQHAPCPVLVVPRPS